MHVRVQKWGNSLALRIPKATADRAGLREGSTVEIESDETKIVARRVHRYVLEELLEAVEPEQLHAEIPTGKKGREAW